MQWSLRTVRRAHTFGKCWPKPEVGAFALHVAWEEWESYFFDI